MESALWFLALGFSALLAIPTGIYAIECVAGSLPKRTDVNRTEIRRPAVAVLVPAHDEERGLAATLKSIRDQMRRGDSLLVVADNCSDNTAAVARACGAEVLERSDAVNRGKGYALDLGLKHLARSPRPVVIFIDADCTLCAGTLDEIARVIAATGRPVQSCNLMTTQGGKKGSSGIAEFAFRVKNLVRPRGLARFGLPCQLTGTGMALPWALIGEVHLAQRHLAEDMKLGIDLAAAGHAPVYCETAGVRSVFPDTIEGTVSQRSRWENGHLAMVTTNLPRLFTPKVFRNRDCLVMTLDIMVPPLTLLALAQAIAIVAGLVVAALDLGWSPVAIAIGSTLLLAASTALAWAAHGRDAIPAADLLRIPAYMLGKAWIYPRAVFGRIDHQIWIRTDRNRT
jgi:cellulose synthase/poly-beta-1,6-N-acetylglucosamine synthase-like glycosyltransferase